ncbi:hypothetical protein SAMD00023353_11400120 [Rosellinia necatrix]|uniref:Uncharacterized protein n=1 Tax=Rosellinia necatrix TaxID=77044 RepID=A0A1S8AB67_ROSNE|nr:hypothetical protein SAMD00023353_11400120 [Rosellinia necatrix]
MGTTEPPESQASVHERIARTIGRDATGNPRGSPLSPTPIDGPKRTHAQSMHKLISTTQRPPFRAVARDDGPYTAAGKLQNEVFDVSAS